MGAVHGVSPLTAAAPLGIMLGGRGGRGVMPGVGASHGQRSVCCTFTGVRASTTHQEAESMARPGDRTQPSAGVGRLVDHGYHG